jgi:hypothetical protein
VRPLLALAAELEEERDHVIPPPAEADDALLDVQRDDLEPGETDQIELIDADAAFAHLLHAGRAVVAAPEQLSAEDEDFLGLPGILSPEQTAALLARRDSAARRRAAGTRSAPEPAAPPPAWRAGPQLRSEVNRLVGVLAARTGRSHPQIHAELRALVPGPASAAAPVDVLELRRDRLLELLGG